MMTMAIIHGEQPDSIACNSALEHFWRGKLLVLCTGYYASVGDPLIRVRNAFKAVERTLDMQESFNIIDDVVTLHHSM
jgi:hypothetical protein